MSPTLNVVGYSACKRTEKAVAALTGLRVMYPSKIDVKVVMLETKDEFKAWLESNKALRESMVAPKAANHSASPFVYSDDNVYIGAVNETLTYARSFGKSACAPLPRVYADPTPAGEFDYDLVVIGGGSGGLACSKAAAKMGKRVAVLDYVKPSPLGSTWGLGGTCVNVGCIPKKLMHQASLLGEARKDAEAFGWSPAGGAHDWGKLVEGVQNYIHSLNFKYRVELRDKSVEYINALGRLTGPHAVECKDAQGAVRTITGARIVVAVGGRPKPLTCPGGELVLSSDDIFSLDRAPGKTLVIGGSYVALECAGFLAGLGYMTTVMCRSILLRGFDQECAEFVGEHMKEMGVNFIRPGVPQKIEKVGEGGRLRVTWEGGSDEFDTVLSAVGRSADTSALGLSEQGVRLSASGTVLCEGQGEQTSVPHLYAIGDVVEGVPELTPSAIQAGKLLAQRLFAGGTVPMDYSNVCTTVFTPLEYGCVGLSEEEAQEQLGADLEVYHSHYMPLEWVLAEDEPGRGSNNTFCKLLVNVADRNRIVGLHYVGPNAGEVAQGFGTAMKQGLTYEDVIGTVGIHPTNAEVLTTLTVTKSSGESADASAC